MVKDLMKMVGAEVSYVYEDLVFIKHNHFLLQFGKKGEELFFYSNTEMKKKEREGQFGTVFEEATEMGFKLIYGGQYVLKEEEGNLNLEFLTND